MVHAELAPFLVDALLGRLRILLDLGDVAGIGVHEHELADVVQQACDGETVAVLVADLGREPVRGVLGGKRVQTEALGCGVPPVERSKKSKVRTLLAIDCTAWGVSRSTAADDGLDALGGAWPSLARRITAISSATSDSTAETMSAVATLSLEMTDSRRFATPTAPGSLERLEGLIKRRP